MADKKISDYTEATSVDPNDWLEIENTGGNSRKIKAGLVKVGWTLVTTWANDIDGAVATVESDVTGATEVLIEMHEVAHSASAHRIVQVRTTAGGSTYYTASGEYADIASTGALTSQTGYYPHSTASSAARSCTMIIRNVSNTTSPKFADMPTRATSGRFTGNATAITHVRVGGVVSAGSTPSGTLQGSGATIRIYKR